MIIHDKIHTIMYLILMYITVAFGSTPDVLVHRNKRACPSGYSSCGWGCCANGASCGYGYYPCQNGCCGPMKCPSGYRACANGPNNCCLVTCSQGTLTCYGGTTYGGTYCCPSGTSCCPPTYSGAGGLCCSSTCPLGHSTCKYGCCANGTPCGYAYYYSGSYCYGPINCPSSGTACASSSNHCCSVTCGSGYITCGGTNTYCCPSGSYCCSTYSSTYGGNYGACCANTPSCGIPPGPCCSNPNPQTPYSSICSYGTCVNGYCTFSGNKRTGAESTLIHELHLKHALF